MRTSWRNPHLRRGDKRPVYLRVGPGSERVGGWVEKHRQAVRCLLFSRYGEGPELSIDIMGLLLSYCRRPGLASWGGANCSARALVWPARLKLALLASLGRRTTMSSGSVCGAAPMSVGLPSH
jgi:hypothetical protein